MPIDELDADIRTWLHGAGDDHDAEIIAGEHEVMRAALMEVIDLHQPKYLVAPGIGIDETVCRICAWSWPCPTVRRVAVALEIIPEPSERN
jgi:hypothetical protein